MDKLLNARDVASILGVHPRYLNALSRRKKFLIPIRLGSADQAQRRWRVSVVEAWIAEREADAG